MWPELSLDPEGFLSEPELDHLAHLQGGLTVLTCILVWDRGYGKVKKIPLQNMSAKLPFTQDLLWISSQNLQHVSRTRYRSQPTQRLELVLDWSLNDPNRLIPPMLWEYASQWWNGCIHRLQLLAVLAPLFLL